MIMADCRHMVNNAYYLNFSILHLATESLSSMGGQAHISWFPPWCPAQARAGSAIRSGSARGGYSIFIAPKVRGIVFSMVI